MRAHAGSPVDGCEEGGGGAAVRCVEEARRVGGEEEPGVAEQEAPAAASEEGVLVLVGGEVEAAAAAAAADSASSAGKHLRTGRDALPKISSPPPRRCHRQKKNPQPQTATISGFPHPEMGKNSQNAMPDRLNSPQKNNNKILLPEIAAGLRGWPEVEMLRPRADGISIYAREGLTAMDGLGLLVGERGGEETRRGGQGEVGFDLNPRNSTRAWLRCFGLGGQRRRRSADADAQIWGQVDADQWPKWAFLNQSGPNRSFLSCRLSPIN